MQNLQSLTNNRSVGTPAGRASGVAYLELPGAAADYATTPDGAALDLTTGLEIITCFSMNDWTPAAAQTPVSKYNSDGGQRGMRFEIRSGGGHALDLSDTGTGNTTGNVGIPVFVDGTVHWIKITWRASDGRMQHFTSNDSPGAIPTNWVQFGTNKTLAIASLFNNTAALMVGRQETAAGPASLIGRMYRMILKSSIDGTTVADFNPDGHAGATSWADGYGNTWTLSGAATVRQ